MMIQVTGQALFGFHREIVAHIGLGSFRMAFFTLVLGMCAHECIAGFLLMIKGFRRFPLLSRMAEAAFVLLEFALVEMHIIFHVALVTGVHETWISRLTVAGHFPLALGRMAFLAV